MLDEFALRYNTTTATVSIAWLIASQSVTALIASATSMEQLSALTQAANLILDNDAVETLNTASAY